MKIDDVTSQLLESIEQQIIELFEEKGSKSNIEVFLEPMLLMVKLLVLV